VIARLVLPDALRTQFAAEARAAFPRECCGLIEGVREGDAARALKLHPARNLASEPDRFEIDPAAQFALLRALRGTERAVIGCYHSHPNGKAEPSPRDREGAGEEGFVWLIVALAAADASPSLAAFAGSDFRALSLRPLA
jgi:proteasome lid subunit RPN8/RPN11